ncbi:MAG: hypothetical protein Q4C70_07620 [Planctomycetia bacterium]|nr:hypothetical protein [Planctomycetia bacterium]
MNFKLERATEKDWDEVAAMIYDSTNVWYEKNRGFSIFQGDKSVTRVYCETYDALEGPGNCVIAREEISGRIAASCFMHPRSTHYSLGIMNVHPDFFGQKLSSLILREIIAESQNAGKPLRLFSSAMNLDSFNLYNRYGFRPYAVFQDMMIPEFSASVMIQESLPESVKSELVRVRRATVTDVPEIVKLEMELAGIERTRDFTHFITNANGIWNTWVLEAEGEKTGCENSVHGKIDGVLTSVLHPASHMLGPGIMRTEAQMLALIYTALSHFAGNSTPVFLVPSTCQFALKTLYGWGAKNTEIHLGQALGEIPLLEGVLMPTFLPETA